jgi:hypothetical protein
MQKTQAQPAAQLGTEATGTTPTPPAPFDEWCLVELYGRQKIAGRVTEATLAGGAFLRVDVPKENGEIDYTRFYGTNAVYSMSPVSKQIAIAWVLAHKPEPVSVYDLTKLARQSALNLPERDDNYGGEED